MCPIAMSRSGFASSNSLPHWPPVKERAASPPVTPQTHGLLRRHTGGVANRRPAVPVPHAANVAGESKAPPGHSGNAVARIFEASGHGRGTQLPPAHSSGHILVPATARTDRGLRRPPGSGAYQSRRSGERLPPTKPDCSW